MSRYDIVVHQMSKGRVDMLSLHIRCPTEESICYRCTSDVQRMSPHEIVVHQIKVRLFKQDLQVLLYPFTELVNSTTSQPLSWFWRRVGPKVTLNRTCIRMFMMIVEEVTQPDEFD
nr:hypothetical protein [Tanacetum cinerariifolium]